jgi:hypothetical protein
VEPRPRGMEIFAESMYDRGIKARGLGSTLHVIDPK